jgi:hypothetical protein
MVFSSAETVEAFGVENLARLGVSFLWIGAESKHETYHKNAGRDLHAIVRDLTDHGVYVLVSGMLFLEHHTKENIQEDIDYVIGLGGTYTQFMMFTPLPVTALYEQFKAEGKIDFDLPLEEWHGQHVLNWHHPEFTRSESTEWLNRAFAQEYERHSSSAYRMWETAVRGYVTLRERGETDPWMARRAAQLRASAEELRLLAPTMRQHAAHDLERRRIDEVERTCLELFGPWTPRMKAVALGARALARFERVKLLTVGNLRQPPARRVRYRSKPSEFPALESPPLRLPLAPDPVR